MKKMDHNFCNFLTRVDANFGSYTWIFASFLVLTSFWLNKAILLSYWIWHKVNFLAVWIKGF